MSTDWFIKNQYEKEVAMAKKIVPITPEGFVAEKLKALPGEAIAAFNELIIKNCSNGSATVVQEDVVELMVKKGLNRNDIFDNHWLDVEELYEKNGWDVAYDKPGYNESYNAYFVFSKKR